MNKSLRSSRRRALRYRAANKWGRIAGSLVTIAFLGCSNSQPDSSQAQEPIPPPISVEVKPAIVSSNPDSIPVQSAAPSLPYQQLGVLQYVEPFSPRAIDEDHIDDRLRAMAVQNWGNNVGAIVGVKTSLSTDANQVTVTAKVVKMAGDCSLCRHVAASPPGQ